MRMKRKIILGVKVSGRSQNVNKIQQLLTTYGSVIKTRLGLHDITEDPENPFGLVLLDLEGDAVELSRFEAELLNIPDIEIQKMYFMLS